MNEKLHSICQETRGANYLPSYCKNSIVMWSEYNKEIIDRELGYAEDLGLNSLRVFLHYKVYESNHQGFLRNLEDFLSLCHNHHIKPMLILFDGCFGYSKETPEGYWGGWSANPGYDLLGKEHWRDYEKYVKDIVAPDSRIAFYDIMNEPFKFFIYFDESKNPDQQSLPFDLKILPMGEEYVRFVVHFANLVKSLQSNIPITIGALSPLNVREIYAFEDVISVHSYEEPDRLKEDLRQTKVVAETENKPLLLTEWGGSAISPYPPGIEKLPPDKRQARCDEVQLKHFERILPLITKEKIGWYIFQLMVAPICPNHGLVHPDGKMRPAASFLKGYLVSSQLK